MRNSLGWLTLRAVAGSVCAAVCAWPTPLWAQDTPDEPPAAEAPPVEEAPPPDKPAPASKSADRKVNVLSVYTSDAYDQADALTKAVEYTLRNEPGYELAEGEHSLEVLALSMECEIPPDAACQTRIADEVQTDRYIWGTLQREGVSVRGTLNYWVRGKGTKSTEVFYSANLTEAADSALQGVARKATFEITGGPPAAVLVITAGTVSGEVFVDEHLVGKLENGKGSFDVPGGEHEIVIRAPGYEELTATVEIQAGKTTDIKLSPVALDSGGETDFRKVGGFIALGMGAAFGAVGLVSHLQVFGDREDARWQAFRQQYPGKEDVCAEARAGTVTSNPQSNAMTRDEAIDLCDRAETFELMQAIFYPLAAVSAGFGVYLLTTADWSGGEDKPAESALSIHPRVGLDGGDLSVRVRF